MKRLVNSVFNNIPFLKSITGYSRLNSLLAGVSLIAVGASEIIKSLDANFKEHFQIYFVVAVLGTTLLIYLVSLIVNDLPSLLSDLQGQDLILRRSVKRNKLNIGDLEKVLLGLEVQAIVLGDKEIDISSAISELKSLSNDSKAKPTSWLIDVDNTLVNMKAAEIEDEMAKKLLTIHPTYKESLDRQVRSRNAAERRGVRNLLIGIFFSTIGIGILAYRAISLKDNDYSTFAMTFLPGAILGILIELLAFFFLRLYSKSLEESKYYANEITILEARFLGYFMATVHGDEAERKAIIADFGKYIRELPALRSTPVLDKATTGALIDLVKSVATATKGANGEG